MDKKESFITNAEALVLAIIWGGTMVASKYALQVFTPTFMIAFRYLVAGLLVGLLYRKHFRNIDKKVIIYGILTGIVIFVGMEVQMWGLKNTDASHQSFILTTYTVIVPIMEWMITKVKPGVRVYISVPLIMLGVALISLSGGMTINKGDIITLLFAFIYSVQIIMIGIYVKRCDRFVFNFFMLFSTGILGVVSLLILGGNYMIGSISMVPMIGLLYLTIMATFISFVLQVAVQSKKTSTMSVILMSLESVFGMITANLILKEPITLKMIIGGSLIVIANILIVTQKDSGGENEKLQDNN